MNNIRREEAEELSVQGNGEIINMDIEIVMNYVKSSAREYQLCLGEEKHIKLLKFIFMCA